MPSFAPQGLRKCLLMLWSNSFVYCEDVLLSMLIKTWLMARQDFQGRENAGKKRGGVSGATEQAGWEVCR